MSRRVWTFTLMACWLVVATSVWAAEPKPGQAAPTSTSKDVILATTTSTVDSGLLDVLVPLFEKRTGYRVKTISVGTGQALAMGEKGEADVLLCHAPAAEKKLVDAGLVTDYQLVMHNDFVIVGPAGDPAGIKGKNSSEAFRLIGQKEALFVSRGDDSGTNKQEKAIWKAAGLSPEGKWYQQSGQGMGATLLMASEKAGYTLTDRATYLAQKANIALTILSEGDRNLLNIYHVMQVNPAKFDRVNAAGAKAFVDFMVAADVQQTIGNFGRDKFGQPLFFPDAGKTMEALGG
ncbi:MAG TPA: tungsten ABC transporter substrate-binding protein [Syntrophobacteraceae bacterium]|nr:tungsten ABC transporter substrate-binding protein [Syntrophobacteraceae bacterium]